MANATHAPLTERRYVTPLILITSLFFLWAFGVHLNDLLVPHLKKAFQLTDLQSSLVQSAFFGGYFLGAWPAGRLMEKIGYKRGILTGLAICSFGALLFIPAATLLWYGFFLAAGFVMAVGQSFLEVAANPYVTILGPPATAERRLNLSQSFNSVGALVTPLVGGALILTNTRLSDAQVAAMSPQQLHMYQAAEAGTVRLPYLGVAMVFLVVAALIYFTHLPEIHQSADPKGGAAAVWKHPHLLRGVVAQFLYVGAQVGVTTFAIRFAEYLVPGTPDRTASAILKWHLGAFMVGRFAGSYIMKYVRPAVLLSVFAGGTFICGLTALLSTGTVAILAVILVGLFHSIMFPTIFALSIKDLGPLTKRGSSMLVMAIIGGSIIPAVMGSVSDATNIQMAFVVPLVCYVYILYFAVRGHRVRVASEILPVGA